MASSKINIVSRLQRWMDSVPGQTFLNYAYSWGASVVILGTLFKITHIKGADLWLFIGMGTEVVVFFLSAFDRPFDKEETMESLNEEGAEAAALQVSNGIVGGSGGGIVIGGGNTGISGGEPGVAAAGGGGGGSTIIIGGGGSGHAGGSSAEGIAGEVGTISGAINPQAISAEVVQGTVENLEQATQEYTEKLKLLTETLDKVEKQSARLTTDSEEMANLNRTLTGINTVYELQLKSISTQVGSIDRINEQTRHMAELIEELNGIYARMIKAMTVNMKNAAGNV